MSSDEAPPGSPNHPLRRLFDNNRAWVTQMLSDDPNYFARLKDQQAPELLWIGCSDSRVPANQITGLPPGEVFVHRNIANIVVHTDLNCLSVLQYAVDALKVKHIMVVGHYGCAGVNAVLTGRRVGLADNWLHHLQDVHQQHVALLSASLSEQARHDRLVELNAIEQCVHVCRTTIVQDAWARGQSLMVHGLVYGVHDGRLRDLGMSVAQPNELHSTYARCIATLAPSSVQSPSI